MLEIHNSFLQTRFINFVDTNMTHNLLTNIIFQKYIYIYISYKHKLIISHNPKPQNNNCVLTLKTQKTNNKFSTHVRKHLAGIIKLASLNSKSTKIVFEEPCFIFY